MFNLLERLKPRERRGSKPRCHLLIHGSPDIVSTRLTKLASPWGVIACNDRWMPQGFVQTSEAQFGRVDTLLDHTKGESLIKWWLAVPKGRVPHWDIASTCTIDGEPGLLLVEAKAHDEELKKEEAGKKNDRVKSKNSILNRAQIISCVKDANASLTVQTGLDWRLSVENHFQMSNRFTWAWKLTELGYPVILIYLGFIKAEEMIDKGVPFVDYLDWEYQVKLQSRALFPEEVWGKKWLVNGKSLIPLIKSCEQKLDF